MPNSISNRLEIRCDSKEDMDKIKSMLFIKKRKRKKTIFSMKKLLPLTEFRSERNNYYSTLTWGTPCDALYTEIVENSDTTVLIYYCTLQTPNCLWVKSLCKQIEEEIISQSVLFSKEIFLEHRYFCYYNEWNGKLEWQPGLKSDYILYDFYEYCERYDPEIYRLFLELIEEETKNP